MILIYRLSIWLYDLAIKLASPVHLKARKFRDGRRDLFTRLARDLSGRNGKLIWIHAASLGEFEQGRPVIENLKQWEPDVKILLTFFSPSGYEVRKSYELADFVYYLPLDYTSYAKRFVTITKPDLAIFIKYELWYYHLMALHAHRIPVLMISAVFRDEQFYFKRYGRFFRKALKQIQHFYVQNESSGKMLKAIGINQYTVAGDTRFDRVIAAADRDIQIPVIEKFKAGEKIMVIGSVWSSDMKVLKPFIDKNLHQVKIILAPHNISKEEIASYLKLPSSIPFSEVNEETICKFRVLILDNIGMLLSAYRYADFAYVGGGIRGALHNALEAAVFGVPVFFGHHPNNSRFLEAVELTKQGGGFEVRSFAEFDTTFERLGADNALYEQACESAKSYVRRHSGATSVIMSGVKELIKH